MIFAVCAATLSAFIVWALFVWGRETIIVGDGPSARAGVQVRVLKAEWEREPPVTHRALGRLNGVCEEKTLTHEIEAALATANVSQWTSIKTSATDAESLVTFELDEDGDLTRTWLTMSRAVKALEAEGLDVYPTTSRYLKVKR